MFLVLNTMIKSHTSFISQTKIPFCKLSSKKYNLNDFEGRIVFDLEKIKGKTDISKIKSILKSINVNWLLKLDENNYINSIVRNQQEYLSKFVLSDLYSPEFFSGSYKNNNIVEISSIEPHNLLFKSPEFNSNGFYLILKDYF